MSASVPLPDAPSLDWLRKQAKRRLDELRKTNPDAQLADAQFDLAKQYGFSSWRALKAHIDSLTVDGQLFEAARHGRCERSGRAARQAPGQAARPSEAVRVDAAARGGAARDTWRRWICCSRAVSTSTHASEGTTPTRCTGPRRRAMLDVVRRLADAGGDVVGHGDDHELEVIGWATCWDGCDDDAHRAVADFLVERGARHHIFSADRDGSRGRGAPDRGRRSVGAQPAHEPQRESPDAAALRRAEEQARDGRAAARARRRSAGASTARASRRRCTRRRRQSTGR